MALTGDQCAITNIRIIHEKDGDELSAKESLIRELEKGEKSAKDGWLSKEDVEKKLNGLK